MVSNINRNSILIQSYLHKKYTKIILSVLFEQAYVCTHTHARTHECAVMGGIVDRYCPPFTSLLLTLLGVKRLTCSFYTIR